MTPTAIQAALSGNLGNLIAASVPGGIEAQEKQGQIDQSFRETLPINGTAKDRPAWEALGFVFGKPADDLFVNVCFPEGWKKSVTDHSMWTNLLDDRGRIRAAIFYKTAFYDRSAHCRLIARFSWSAYEATPDENIFRIVIRDGLKSILVLGAYARRDFENKDKLEAQAKAWLKENKPDWQNQSAYWNEP